MKKIIYSFLVVLLSISFAQAQNVTIPDANFKAYLVGNASINTNMDTEIQVSEAVAFTGLIYCPNLSIADLTGIEAFTALTQLQCNNNLLTSLDVSQNIALTYLNCKANQLTSLDVSSNTSLTDLRCYSNQLTSLDVSSNTSLVSLYCYNNQLTELNVANGNNTNFTNFEANMNSGLTCIQVDDSAYSANNWTIIDAWASFSEECCVITIPDANFKSYLVGNAAINTNADSEIQCSEASAFTGTIDCSNLSIADLTGIEAFTALTRLHCHVNQLTALDVSQNTALTHLYCNNNQITALDVTQNTNLDELVFSSNQITSINLSQNAVLTYLNCNDNLFTTLDVSQNTGLTHLRCSQNDLLSLDIATNTGLTQLQCHSNQLSNLDVSNNTLLEQIWCSNNQITSLDLSQNTVLEELYCETNQLTTLDLSNNVGILYLYCSTNQLTTLDIGGITGLTELECNDNQLTQLNAANGNNTNFTYFNAADNNLTCIQVDDSTYSANNWTNIDVGASFSEDCGYITSVEEELIVISFYPNPAVDQLNVALEKPATAHIVNALSEVKAVYSLYAGNNILDISDLSTGIYFFQTASGGIFKFVKE